MGNSVNRHEYDRKLTPTERKEIAITFGWRAIDGVRGNLIGMRPMYDIRGKHYAWIGEEHVPCYDYDTLRFVRACKAFILKK